MVFQVGKGKRAKSFPVSSYAEAAAIWDGIYTGIVFEGKSGSLGTDATRVILKEGKTVAFASQNGKIWEGPPPTTFTEAMKVRTLLFDPRA